MSVVIVLVLLFFSFSVDCEPSGIPNAHSHIVKIFTVLSLAWRRLFKSKHVALTYAFIIQLCWLKYIYIYTGCPRRKGQNFGRVFLRLNYTDITQNTYIQSWTVAEIIARENCGLLAVPRTVCSALRNPHRATDLEWRVACSAGRMWSGQCAL